jgi:glycerol-3-phosphate acyltransferase PlsY
MSIDATRLLLVALAFFSGSIPYAVIVARARGVDIRAVGSKNPGAHNVMLHVGRGWGWLVTILDLLKGAVPALIARLAGLGSWDVIAVGVAAMLGHIFSPFLGFRGGKGVATGFGMLLVLAPIEMLIGSVTGLLILRAIRIVTIAAAIAALLTFGLMITIGESVPVLAAPWIMVAVSGLVGLIDEMKKASGSIGRLIRNVFSRGK